MNKAKLRKVEQQNNTVQTFWFDLSQPLDYTAGQFVELSIDHTADDRGTRRWFTISSSPTEAGFAITTRKLPNQSTFKQRLFALKAGDEVHVSQAMGDFVLPIQQSIPILFVVKGIGITPVRSILQYLSDTKEQRNISVINLVKNESDTPFSDLLPPNTKTIIGTELDKLKTIINVTKDHIKNTPNTRIYVSGPEQFVEKTYDAMLAAEIKESGIVTDYFHGYDIS